MQHTSLSVILSAHIVAFLHNYDDNYKANQDDGDGNYDVCGDDDDKYDDNQDDKKVNNEECFGATIIMTMIMTCVLEQQYEVCFATRMIVMNVMIIMSIMRSVFKTLFWSNKAQRPTSRPPTLFVQPAFLHLESRLDPV